MKVTRAGMLSFMLLLALGAVAPVGAARTTLSPITRIVDLLKGLSAKMDEEHDMEEGLYKKFVCWGKSIIESKTASNEAANAKIQSLEAYIADINAGAVEFTSERTDLEKEIAGLNADIELATEMRGKENGEFDSASTEMKQAVAALEKAVAVLGTATQDNTGGVLLTMGTEVNEGFAARAAEAASLEHAADLGAKFLSKGDALFLRRLLTGDVPTADWKKLNRKATFAMSYHARSFKIQEVLAQLLMTFKENLVQATSKEGEALAEFNKLISAKTGLKTTAENALTSGDSEGGARTETKEASQDEVDALTTQVTNDLRFISETTASLAAKKIEWKERSDLRAAEQAAISEAIGVLYSDDKRDTFKKSFDSQGFLQVSFLQESRSSKAGQSAAAVLRETGRVAHDQRLSSLAASLENLAVPAPAPAPVPRVTPMGWSHFDAVIGAIDTMVSVLKTEMDNDLTQKEGCEKYRADEARKAILSSRDIDDKSDHITTLLSEIDDLAASIKAKEEELTNIREESSEALRIRGEENADWIQTNADDTVARDTVIKAAGVLTKFYSDNNLGLAQMRQTALVRRQAPGDAPPPPPTTWDAPYGGKTGESQGIIAILDMVKEDIIKDMAKAKAEEDKAASDYAAAFAEFQTQESTLMSDIGTETVAKTGKTTEVGTTKTQRGNEKLLLDVYIQNMKDSASTGCDFMTIHFEPRKANRQFEIDGLQKAKAILEGATFSFLQKGSGRQL